MGTEHSCGCPSSANKSFRQHCRRFYYLFLKIAGLNKRENAQYQIIRLFGITSIYLARKFSISPSPEPLPSRPGSSPTHQHSSNGTCILSPQTTDSRRNNTDSIVAFDSSNHYRAVRAAQMRLRLLTPLTSVRDLHPLPAGVASAAVHHSYALTWARVVNRAVSWARSPPDSGGSKREVKGRSLRTAKPSFPQFWTK